MTSWSSGCKIEAPSICYPTLPMLIQRWVPVGMQIPNPTPMIITSGSTAEDRDSQVIRQCTRTYSCVAHHHHEDQTKGLEENRSNKSLNRKPKSRGQMQHASQCNKRCKSGLTGIQMDHPGSRTTKCQENPRKLGGMQNEVKTPNFEKLTKRKLIWPLGLQTPKIQK